ncbi:MAG: hypothetical protein KJZ93_21080 [Caldilineaceae bacterium]|nr:hypothetical protein [Caldilineaceae bacterium]
MNGLLLQAVGDGCLATPANGGAAWTTHPGDHTLAIQCSTDNYAISFHRHHHDAIMTPS